MCPPPDWFDEIVAGDPLRPDPSPRPDAVGDAGSTHTVTEGYDDLFVDFDEEPAPPDGSAGSGARRDEGSGTRGDAPARSATDERAADERAADEPARVRSEQSPERYGGDDDLIDVRDTRPRGPSPAQAPSPQTSSPQTSWPGDDVIDAGLRTDLAQEDRRGDLDEDLDDGIPESFLAAASTADVSGADGDSASVGDGAVEWDSEPEDAAYAGEGWAADGGAAPQDAPWECDIDTSPVSTQEMTGIWLTTESGRESPLRLDGSPAEPEDLGLPADVADRLRDWSDQWRAEWDDATGWSPRARIGDYEALGHWLARRVKDHTGPVAVTLQLAHLGRAGVEPIEAADRRPALVVRLANSSGRAFPVEGDFVTDSGVGSFSAELNAKLEGWAAHFADHMDPVTGWGDRRAARDHAAFAGELAADMQDELGPDYRVDLDLWELGGVLEAEGPRR